MKVGEDWNDQTKGLEALDSPDNAEEGASLLETVVNAHYLALQMRMLVKARRFTGSEATELLASALTEWAQLAGGECFEPPSLSVLKSRDRH
ncbi:hypothetical protein CCR94_19790 [Rhodoblastus sphagnicola]|uniref:Uncharacterized protein n=1 Tax=Rhodoblastus sphagnicola TaxID=333368 RepID=A0A2S6MYM5_9HYPH|nr:hypothetical protein [Rhodoblastus sphagnicola]MBB4196495.1 hypothetical protein [Rhodoblastus sphagnicola]PPQ27475.1 hypothetical protein CCR94_19790 [Rhodoblastus sphagnicola]